METIDDSTTITNSVSMFIDPDNWKQKRIISDIHFYFKRLDRLTRQSTRLTKAIIEKQNEADQLIGKINEEMKNLHNEEDLLVYIEEEVETLDDLIFIAKKYGMIDSKIQCSIDPQILYDLVEPLEKLRDIIGMENIKDEIVDQILTSLQSLYDDDLMFHTVIKGPPGVGKTMLAKILGEIYRNMGIIQADENGEVKFKIATRADLIGKYLGHTAIKTQDFIDSCEGGVMFIDEVYSLGNQEKRDSFAKECIDTLNLNLTEKKNFICIVAGYSDEIESCFFAFNPGLRRRFPFSYEITGYSAQELREIFISKLRKADWDVDLELQDDLSRIDSFLKEKLDSFEHFGGDIDNFILNCKIVHGRRVFGKQIELRRKLLMIDLEKGYDRMMNNKTKNNDDFDRVSHMYM